MLTHNIHANDGRSPNSHYKKGKDEPVGCECFVNNIKYRSNNYDNVVMEFAM